MIVFAATAPHPPILLPEVGSKEDRKKVEKTLRALGILAENFKKARPDEIIISSPHPDWGFEVPLYFLAKNFQGRIERVLIGLEPPQEYFEKGTKFPISNSPTRLASQHEAGRQFPNKFQIPNSKIALIASGDLSHCLKVDGPYGFHPDGPKFDKALIKYLEKKDVENFLKLDEKFPEAGECGFRSFSFLLGILEASNPDYQPEVLSYEGPFGVGYLVARLV